MSKKVYILILLLAIGFASITTSLVINGSATIGVNETDYDIFFSEAILDDVDRTNTIVDASGQSINFDTNELTLEGETSILEYEVTNNSKQYDAEVRINCMVEDSKVLDYIKLTYYIDKDIIPARSKANGNITVKLEKAFADDLELRHGLTCRIETSAVEKETLNLNEVEKKQYYTYGYLVNEDNEPIKNASVIVYGNDAKFATTDDRGMFIISDLSSGEYDLYVVENTSVEELQDKSKEEMALIASQTTHFHTKADTLNFENNILRYGKVIAGTPIIKDVTFNTNGGTIENFESKIIEGQGVGFLPSIDHDNLLFKDWLSDGSSINEETVIDGNTLLANYGEGVAKIGDKQFKTLNNAFDYVNNDSETTIEVIKDTSLTAPINTDKNIILDLNSKNVNFNNNSITNTANLTIKNGNITSDGENVFINSGNLNLIDNLNIEHINNTNETVAIKTITNNKSSTLNMDKVNLHTEFNSFVIAQSMISNYGTANINNSNINSKDAVIFIYEDSKLDLNNSIVTTSYNIEAGRMFNVYGEFNYINSEIKVLETNEQSAGVIITYSNGITNILSGTLDNSYGKSNSITISSGGTVNIGSKDSNIKIVGNGTNSYTINNSGSLNILDGTITTEKGYFIGNSGRIKVGSQESTPTIYGSKGYNVLDNRSKNKEDNEKNRIINANIYAFNGFAINIYSGSKLVIDNISIIQNDETRANRSVNVSGELIINDGSFKMSEDNLKGMGLFNVQKNAKITINNGMFDNTYGKSNAIWNDIGSEFNIGSNDSNITFIGNSTNNYIISNYGYLNIQSGTLNSEKGYFIGNFGKINIGSESSTPTINGGSGYGMIDIRSANAEDNERNKIINANINVFDSTAINVYANKKLQIDNIQLIQTNETLTNRAINVSGELIINDGSFKTSENNIAGYGLINVQKGAKVTINSGTYDNTYGKSNAIWSNIESELNVGFKNSIINFTGNGDSYPIIISYGKLNIIDGTLNSYNGGLICSYGDLLIGSKENIPTLNGNGYNLISIYKSTNQENPSRIIENANINICDSYGIYVTSETKMTINNINLITMGKEKWWSAIITSGELVINDGTFKVAEENKTYISLLQMDSGAVTTINSGYFDSTYSNSGTIGAHKNTILNLGSSNKEITIIGSTPDPKNGGYNHAVSSAGVVNIIDGTINASSCGPLFSFNGSSVIGTEETTPIINSSALIYDNTGPVVLQYGEGINHIIKNAIINAQNENVINTYIGVKVLIENANITQSNTQKIEEMIRVYDDAEITINNGKFDSINDNNSSQGIFYVGNNGKLNIDGGIYNYNGPDNLLYSTFETSEVNIGKNKKNDIVISSKLNNKPTIANHGNLNIYSGTITAGNSNTIIQGITDSEEQEASYTSAQRLDYKALINIYGGYIENNSDKPTISTLAGKLVMQDGEVVNKGTGLTLYNSGGTAIQKGGISLNNFGVTIE